MNVEAPIDQYTKRKALAGAGLAIVLTIAAWVGINRATVRGLHRLDALAQVKAECDSVYTTALTGRDTARMDSRPLSVMIDPGSSSAPRRCGDIRRASETQTAKDSVRRAEAIRQMLPSRPPR